MKDATKHIIILAALLALAVSCSKETGGAVDPAVQTEVPLAFHHATAQISFAASIHPDYQGTRLRHKVLTIRVLDGEITGLNPDGDNRQVVIWN